MTAPPRVLSAVLLMGTCLRQKLWVNFSQGNVAFVSCPMGAECAAAILPTLG